MVAITLCCWICVVPFALKRSTGECLRGGENRGIGRDIVQNSDEVASAESRAHEPHLHDSAGRCSRRTRDVVQSRHDLIVVFSFLGCDQSGHIVLK
jgi:hypothetical protein